MPRYSQTNLPKFTLSAESANTLGSHAFHYYALLTLISMLLWALLAFIIFLFVSNNNRQNVMSNLDLEMSELIEIKQSNGEKSLIEAISTMRYSHSLYSLYYLYADENKLRIAGDLNDWPSQTVKEDNLYYFDIPVKSYFEPEKGVTNVLAKIHQFDDGTYLLVAHSTRIFSIYVEFFTNGGLILMGIAIPLGLLSAFYSAYLNRRAYESLNKSIRQIMTGDLNERIDLKTNRVESRELAENLNKMLDTISLLMEDVRRVSDNIAHDLNTPLSRLHNNIKHLIEESPEEQKEKLDVLLAECNDILATFNALLVVAKIESSSSTIDKQTINMATVINDIVDLYDPLAESNGISITTFTKNAGAILADRNLIFQIVANIVDNSIKYSDANTEIEINVYRGIYRKGTCTLDALDYERIRKKTSNKREREDYESRHYLSVVISDRGIGIPRDSHKKIFQRFYREEKSRGIKPGNGLGLSMVMAVMQIHHGAIYVDSLSPGLSIALVLPKAVSS